MINSRSPRSLFFVVLLLVMPLARADEPSTREAELSGLVERLESRLDQVEKELAALKDQSVSTPPPASTAPALEAQVAPPLAPDAPQPLQAYWRDGLELRSADGSFAIRVGGRIQLDTAFFDEDSQ